MNLSGIMIDTETLATTYDACLVSIGACKFCLSKGVIDTFYINIDAVDCKKMGLRIDPKTIEWWKGQPKEARDAWQKDPVPLREALEKFNEWYGEKSHPTWAKGGHTFDFPIMNNAFNVSGVAKPWNYSDCFDYRTLLHVTKINDYKFKTKGTVLHNALDDAIEQTKMLIPILKGFEDWEPF